MKLLRILHAAVFTGCLIATSGASHAADDSGNTCAAGQPEPPAAYPLPLLTAHDIATRFVPPTTVAQLLSNLRIVLDQNLLAQPAFFEDEVIRALFGTDDVEWVKPGTPGVAAERFVKPTRIARVRLDANSTFAGLQFSVGVNHKCLEARPHPSRPGVTIPPHVYDSGYVHMHVNRSAVITIGDVRQAFGSNAGEFERQCRSPLMLIYQGPPGPTPQAFRLHAAEFEPSWVGYQALCQAAGPHGGLPDEHPISFAWIRLLQEDYTLLESVTP